MRKITIALILFQLIGCAKQPAIVTNQNEINRLKAEIGKERSKLEAKIETIEKERESYANEIFWNRVVAAVGIGIGIGIGVIAIIASVGIVINNRKLTEDITTLQDQQKNLQAVQAVSKAQQDNLEAEQKGMRTELGEGQQTLGQDIATLKHEQQGWKRNQRSVRYELKKLKEQQPRDQQELNALRDAHKDLQAAQTALQTRQNELRNEFSNQQNALEEQLTGLKSQQATLQKAHTELQQKDTAIEERIKENTKALNTRINATNGRIEDVTKKVTASLDPLVLRVQQTSIKLDEVEAAQKKLVETQNGLAANQNGLNEHQNQLEAQQNKFQEIQKALADAQEALREQVQTPQAAFVQIAQDLMTEFRDARNGFNNIIQTIIALNNDHKELVEREIATRERQSELEQRVNTLTTEFRIAEQKQRKFEDQVQESQTALKQATQETMATCIDARTEFESAQNAQDIDRIVQSSAERMRHDYPGVEGDILQVYPDKGGLEAILKWYLLQPVPRGTIGARPGETYLSYQREYVKRRLDEEVEIEQRTHPERPMPVLFIKIERHEWCLIGNINQELLRIQDYMEKLGEGANVLAPFAITYTARIVILL